MFANVRGLRSRVLLVAGLIAATSLSSHQMATAQTSAPNQWAWVGGSSTIVPMMYAAGRPGVYGTLGTPALGNIPGGRLGATTWTDSNGNFWFFGGGGYDAIGKNGLANDLWEFNPLTNQWAWMGGSSTWSDIRGYYGVPGVYGTLGTPAAGNVPGGRYFASSWTDSSGNVWLFGGSGYDANSK